MAEPAYLTALQVAGLLQVDEKTALRWSLQDASMRVLPRGRVVRFPRERLLAPGAAFGPAISAGTAQTAGHAAQRRDFAVTHI
jgi:hypothetical protein